MHIRRLTSPAESDAEARYCTTMMISTDPWVTLGRTFDDMYPRVIDPTREVYVGVEGDRIVGFVILNMHGSVVGYVHAIVVDPELRGSGIGTQLLTYAEERIFREQPNVFLCVSSFNLRARALYERLGYRLVGEIPDYLVRGASEFLMRKTIGPMSEFFGRRVS
jgi:ribosomal protein S18 acetylase RimI-like enzyme